MTLVMMAMQTWLDLLLESESGAGGISPLVRETAVDRAAHERTFQHEVGAAPLSTESTMKGLSGSPATHAGKALLYSLPPHPVFNSLSFQPLDPKQSRSLLLTLLIGLVHPR